MGDTIEVKARKAVFETPFKNEMHEGCIRQIYQLFAEQIEEPDWVEPVGVSRTYKIVLKDGRIWKAYLAVEPLHEDLQRKVHSCGINVPPVIGYIKIPKSNHFWKTTGWAPGKCDRDIIKCQNELKNVDPKWWYKKGELLGKIASIEVGEQSIAMTDILWTNFTMDAEKDEVWLIDCKKLNLDFIPERWILYFIYCNQYHTLQQKQAFMLGYVDGLKPGRRRLDMIKSAKEFLEKVYEKLAGQ